MLKESPLGQATIYTETYSPELLFPIPRRLARDKTGISEKVPFHGIDIWNGYELSWLNSKGKPEIAMAEFTFSSATLNVIESKSFKLYLNSFNQSRFPSFDEVQTIMENDLSKAACGEVKVHLFKPDHLKNPTLHQFTGVCLDSLDIETDTYEVNTDFLKTTPNDVEEILYTNLLKSNCLATGQPDWGSVYVNYSGPKIDMEGLLKYFISFRRHAGFAEHCVEEIFCDILEKCAPKNLSVYARYTRRGGLDINPFRSNFQQAPENLRQFRQ